MWDDKVIFLRSNFIVAVRLLSFVKDYCSTKLQFSDKYTVLFWKNNRIKPQGI